MLADDGVENAFDETDRNTFGLGEVKDEVRVCCQGRYGCRKSSCCTGIVLGAIFLQLIGLGTVIATFMYSYFVIMRNPYIPDSILKMLWNIELVSSPYYACLVAKIYFGCAWFVRKRTRRAFLPYYRVSMTANCSTTFFCLSNVSTFLALNEHFEAYFQLAGVALMILETVFLEIHMRHLDTVQYAKHSLLKDI